MAVTIPVRFVLRAGGYSGEVAAGRRIGAASVGVISGNNAHLYAYSLRALLEWAGVGPMATSAASGGAREVMVRAYTTAGPRRKSVHYVVDGKELSWEVRVVDSGGSTLASATGSMGGTRAQSSGTLDLYPSTSTPTTAQALSVLLLGKRASGTDGELWGVRVLEEAVVAGDLPG